MTTVTHPCHLDGCVAQVIGHGLCGMHYARWSRHGDPLYSYEPPVRCLVEDCENEPRIRAMCDKHYSRWQRHGDTSVVIDTRLSDVKYRAAHKRVSTDRGPAHSHHCVDCAGQAHHWSYTHTDPDERQSPGGQPYSLNPQHYEPRCATCHARFDLAH